jgi:hypothetical protein
MEPCKIKKKKKINKIKKCAGVEIKDIKYITSAAR